MKNDMKDLFLCIIVVKNRGVLNIPKTELRSEIRKIFKKEDLDNKFSVNVNENVSPGYSPSIYVDLGVNTIYFDMFIAYTSSGQIKYLDIENIAEILKFLWNRNVPAATYCYEEDFEEQLPWKGGNDLDKVFWKDPDLEGI